MDKFRAAALAIVEDIEDRSGLSNEWDNIDPDIRDEIVNEWARLIKVQVGEC